MILGDKRGKKSLFLRGRVECCDRLHHIAVVLRASVIDKLVEEDLSFS